MKHLLSCLLLAFLFYLPITAAAKQTATVTAHIGAQSSRALLPNPLHLFSNKKTSIDLRFDGLCKPVYGIRVALRQLTSKLAIPLGVLHEEISKDGSPLSVPSEVTVHITLPELNRQSSFELVISARFQTSNHWTVIDTSPIYAYSTDLFNSAAQYKEFVFVLFDQTKGLQQLFTATSIPFVDFQENPDGVLVIDDEKVLLALCHFPGEQNRTATEYALELKEVADHDILFKPPKDDFHMLLIREQENRIEIQASNSLLTDLQENPASQTRLLALVELVANFTRKTTKQ